MKLDIQNGLSYTGRVRARNYHERSSAPNKKIDCCSFAKSAQDKEILMLRRALTDACRIIAADSYVSSQKSN